MKRIKEIKEVIKKFLDKLNKIEIQNNNLINKSLPKQFEDQLTEKLKSDVSDATIIFLKLIVEGSTEILGFEILDIQPILD